MPLKISRRDFMWTGVCSAAAVALLRPTEARAWIVAAIAIASAVAGLVSAFTERGDGGLGAILTSIRQLQLETISQLQNIQIGLANIDAKLQALPDQIAGLLDQANLKRLDAELKGSFERFKEVVVVRNLKRRLSASEKASLAQSQREVLVRVINARTTLQSTNEIAGLPHCALIAAYILPIEMSLRVYVGEPKEQIAVALQSYRDWQQAMLDADASAAIPAYISGWLSTAEGRFKTASERSDFAKSLFSASPGSVERCYNYREYIPGQPAKYRTHHCPIRAEACDGDTYELVEPAVPQRVGQQSRVFTRVTQAIDNQTGANLIDVAGHERSFEDWDAAQSGVSAFRATLSSNAVIGAAAATTPPAFVALPNVVTIEDLKLTCQSLDAGFGLTGPERIAKIISDPPFGHKALRDEFERTFDDVQGVNEARLYVAFGVNCQQVAVNLIPQIERCERIYAS